MTQPNPPIIGKTRNTELTIDQIAEMQPGLATLMLQVGDRYWTMYYAAKGGNWPLARHEVNEMRALMRTGAITRPRYANQLNTFMSSQMDALAKAVAAQDFAAFDVAFKKAAEVANAYHVDTGHSEILWQLPDEPPKQLSLKPPVKKG